MPLSFPSLSISFSFFFFTFLPFLSLQFVDPRIDPASISCSRLLHFPLHSDRSSSCRFLVSFLTTNLSLHCRPSPELASAQLKAGLCLRRGLGVPQDLTKAAFLFRQSARQNNSEAQYRFAKSLRFGEGVRVQPFKSHKYALLSAAGGFARGQCLCGHLYEIRIDETGLNSIRYFRAAALQGDSVSQLALSIFLALGRGTPPNFTSSKHFQNLAIPISHGNVEFLAKPLRYAQRYALIHDSFAHFLCGWILYHGIGYVSDANASTWHFEQAAQYKYAPAMIYLGKAFLKGIGVERDEEAALEYFRRAAKFWMPYEFANMVWNEKDDPKNVRRAKKYLQRAIIRANDTQAMVVLGCFYLNGVGFEKKSKNST